MSSCAWILPCAPTGNRACSMPIFNSDSPAMRQPPKLSEVREAVLEIRKAKSMVLSENDPDCRSAGSFFKNLILDQNSVSVLEAEARASGRLNASESIPRFAAGPGKEKLPAAWFIEHAGFHKGYTHKNAGISSKHALALINRGGATAQDILELMRMIQDRVQLVFGVELAAGARVCWVWETDQEPGVRTQNSLECASELNVLLWAHPECRPLPMDSKRWTLKPRSTRFFILTPDF